MSSRSEKIIIIIICENVKTDTITTRYDDISFCVPAERVRSMLHEHFDGVFEIFFLIGDRNWSQTHTEVQQTKTLNWGLKIGRPLAMRIASSDCRSKNCEAHYLSLVGKSTIWLKRSSHLDARKYAMLWTTEYGLWSTEYARLNSSARDSWKG